MVLNRFKKLMIACFLIALIFVSIQAPMTNAQESEQPPTELPYPGPSLDEFWWIYIPSPDAQLEAMLSGAVDGMDVSRPDIYETLVENGFKIRRFYWPGEGGFWYNCREGPTADVQFRRALAHLVDYDGLITAAYGALGEREVAHLNKGFSKYYNPDVITYEYDPGLASWLLDEAGYTINPATGVRIDPATGEDLEPLRFVYCSEWPDYVLQTEGWSSEIEDIGVPVELIATDFAGWYDKVLYIFEYDLTIISWGWSSGLPDALNIFYHSGSIGPGELNLAGFSNETADEFMDKIVESIDEDEIIQAAYTVQEILAEQVPMIPVTSSIVNEAWNPDLLGLVVPGHCRSMMYRERLIGPRWPTPGGALKIAVGDQPSTLNPIHEPYGAGNEIVIIGGGWVGIEYHLWTGEFTPWRIEDWEVEPWSDASLGVENGMKTTLTVREGVYWHDGFEFTAEDVVFSILYLKDKEVPGARKMWKELVDAKVIDKYVCEVYHNTSSLLMLDYISEYACRLPKHIWNDNVTRYGEPAGIPEGSYDEQVGYGVQDYTVFLPYKVQNPYDEDLTCLINTGAFMFPKDGWERDVSVHVVANRNYFMTLLFSDLNMDFKVDMNDLDIATEAMGAQWGDPEYKAQIDLSGDGVIDETDVTMIEADLGKTWGWPIEFTFSDLTVSPVEPKVGEEATITVTVTNEGEEEATYQAILKVEGAPVDYEEVTLGAGASTTVTFKVMKDEGTYSIDVGGETTTLTVAGLAPAAFSVTGVTVSPSEVETGVEATVTASVENTGDLSGTYTAELKVNGATEDTEDVTVGAGESKTVTFKVTKDEAGTYTIDVGGMTATFTVTSPPKPTQTWLYVGIAAVVIIVIAAYFLMRRS